VAARHTGATAAGAVASTAPARARGRQLLTGTDQLLVQDPETLEAIRLPAWKMSLLPRTPGEITLMRRLDIVTRPADRFHYAVVTLLTVSYTFLASSCLEPLNCMRMPNGSFVLRAASDTPCYDAAFYARLPFISAMIALYVGGIPTYLLLVLLRARRAGVLGSPGFEYRFGALTLPYSASCWFFELVNTLRKLAVVVVVQFLGRDGSAEATVSQIMLCSSIFSVYTLLQVFYQPHGFVWLNRLSLMTTVTLLVVLFTALLYANPSLAEAGMYYAGVFTVAVIAVTAAVILFACFREYERARVRSHTCRALGLNRYQLAAMERHLLGRMFPAAGPALIAQQLQLGEVERDAFLRDCFQLLGCMPAEGMNPFEALRRAQRAALGGESDDDEESKQSGGPAATRRSMHDGSNADQRKRQREADASAAKRLRALSVLHRPSSFNGVAQPFHLQSAQMALRMSAYAPGVAAPAPQAPQSQGAATRPAEAGFGKDADEVAPFYWDVPGGPEPPPVKPPRMAVVRALAADHARSATWKNPERDLAAASAAVSAAIDGSAESRMLWTGRQVELVRFVHNPVAQLGQPQLLPTPAPPLGASPSSAAISPRHAAYSAAGDSTQHSSAS
jgi:hypothetical protein